MAKFVKLNHEFGAPLRAGDNDRISITEVIPIYILLYKVNPAFMWDIDDRKDRNTYQIIHAQKQRKAAISVCNDQMAGGRFY